MQAAGSVKKSVKNPLASSSLRADIEEMSSLSQKDSYYRLVRLDPP